MRFYNTLQHFPSTARNPLMWGFWAIWRMLSDRWPEAGGLRSPLYSDADRKRFPMPNISCEPQHNKPDLRLQGNIREGPD